MTLSFRTILLCSNLGILLLVTTLIGGVSYFLARFSVEDLGTRVLAESTDRIEHHVWMTLETADAQSRIIERLLERGTYSLEDHESLSEYAHEAVAALEVLSFLSLGLESGKYWHIYRDNTGELSTLWLLPGPNGRRRLFEFRSTPDGSREVIRDIANSRRTAPTERPYYIAAREAGRPIWTETYVFLGSGESLDIPGVSRAVPIHARDGNQLLGVLTADFDLHAMSRFLRTVPVGEAGFAFIVEERRDGTRRVIAHPDAAHPNPTERLELTRPAPSGEGRVTVRADEVGDVRVRHLVSELAVVPAAEEFRPTPIDGAGGGYVGGYRRLGGEGAPSWTICVLMPRDEIVGNVRRMAFVSIAVALAGILAVAALAVGLARRVSSRLRAISEETAEVASFRLEPRPIVPTRITEIRDLGRAVEEMKTGLRSFQRYVPTELVRLILESGEEARLGGERRTITIYFSDIADFTSISESLSPEELVSLLAEYLEAMTKEMLRAGGTVDKYIGDAIMAFWGAPRSVPDHPLVACRTALSNQATLRRLRERWSGEGRPPLRARIGLHTGEAIVGNFGSESRLDYTAIGDAVNLASRLEGLNRRYGTEILMSDATLKHVEAAVIVRPLDKIAVKGREQGIVIHELLGLAGEVPEETLQRAAEHCRGFECYLDQRWDEALRIFGELLRESPGDRSVKLLVDRCEQFREASPNEWTGVHRWTTK